MTARVGCPPVPFFLRQRSSRNPSLLVASQPSPTAAAMLSLFPPLNDAGASSEITAAGGEGAGNTAGLVGAAGAADGMGVEAGKPLGVAPDVGASDLQALRRRPTRKERRIVCM